MLVFEERGKPESPPRHHCAIAAPYDVHKDDNDNDNDVDNDNRADVDDDDDDDDDEGNNDENNDHDIIVTTLMLIVAMMITMMTIVTMLIAWLNNWTNSNKVKLLLTFTNYRMGNLISREAETLTLPEKQEKDGSSKPMKSSKSG